MLAHSFSCNSCSRLSRASSGAACASRSSLARQTRLSGRKARPQHFVRAHKVSIEYEGGTAELDVPDGATILETALEQGLDLKHDCKMGVCMTCPGKVISGEVDQSAGMLDDGAREKGYALLCVSQPLSDCKVATISEEEILDEVLCA